MSTCLGTALVEERFFLEVNHWYRVNVFGQILTKF